MTTASTSQTPPTPQQISAAWDRLAAGFDEHVTSLNIDFGDEIVGRLGVTADTRFLDVATGTGALAIPAARRGAHVVATDISEGMIGRLQARARGERLTDIEARVMDGHALDLADDSVDVAASLNGVSLFADIDRGVREMVRVTRPGGRVGVIAFGPPSKAEFLTFFLGALRAAIPGFAGPSMDPPPLPFQVADPRVLHGKLTAAGLGDVTVEPTAWEMPIRSVTHLLDVVSSSNPLGAQLLAGLTAEQRTDVQEVLDGMLREHSGGSPDAVLHAAMNVGVGTA